MILYHGSNIPNIKILKPQLADNDRPYIYMSTIKIVAGFYLVNAVEKPYYWFPYGFDDKGRVIYHELYKSALKEVSAGKKGYIYLVDVDEKDVIPFKNIPCAKLAIKPLSVIDCLAIDDCFEWLLEQEQNNEFIVSRYEEKSSEELCNWYDGVYEYIKEKNMIDTPYCSYARFIKLKFPQVWERYETEFITLK